MRRRRIAGLLAALSLVMLGLGAPAAVADGGNSDAAHACQQGGYQDMYRADGTGFANAGECVSYAARGGQFQQPVATCTVTASTGCLTFDNATMQFLSGTLKGSTITVSAVYTFNSTTTGFSELPNSDATGAGTYVIKDADGNVVQDGTLTAADTGEYEGLYFAGYTEDGSPASCAAADQRTVSVVASTNDPSDPFLAVVTTTTDTASDGAAGANDANENVWQGAVGSAVSIAC